MTHAGYLLVHNLFLKTFLSAKVFNSLCHKISIHALVWQPYEAGFILLFSCFLNCGKRNPEGCASLEKIARKAGKNAAPFLKQGILWSSNKTSGPDVEEGTSKLFL